MPRKQGKNLIFVDLFAGIGGFHLGIKQAAKKVGIEAECNLAVDIDKKARDTYASYFKNASLMEDIRDSNVKNSISRNVDIVCAGFPCQPFSQAGRRKGFEDARGTLFFDIDAILELKNPPTVFLENVRNLVSHDHGYTLGRILQQLEKRGYDIIVPMDQGGLSERDLTRQYVKVNEGKRWAILRASDYGSPTHRPRVYIVAFHKKKVSKRASKLFKFPEPTGEKITLASVLGKPWPDVIGKTLRVGGRNSPHGDRHNWDSYNGTDRSIQVIGPGEGLKIMGFPKDFNFPDKLSVTQQMKQIGNSVAVPVIQAVAEEIIKVLRVR